jgi:hypothetical protein
MSLPLALQERHSQATSPCACSPGSHAPCPRRPCCMLAGPRRLLTLLGHLRLPWEYRCAIYHSSSSMGIQVGAEPSGWWEQEPVRSQEETTDLVKAHTVPQTYELFRACEPKDATGGQGTELCSRSSAAEAAFSRRHHCVTSACTSLVRCNLTETSLVL